jgi:hypothetical protein
VLLPFQDESHYIRLFELCFSLKILTIGHISESLETIFWVKILKFFDADADADADPDSGIFLTRDPRWKKFEVRDKHPGSATR